MHKKGQLIFAKPSTGDVLRDFTYLINELIINENDYHLDMLPITYIYSYFLNKNSYQQL